MVVTSESARYWRTPLIGNTELLHAHYVEQTFSRHTHEEYAIGVIETGAMEFFYRGSRVVAPAGSVNLCIPGEAHNGQAVDASGWTYRMFYFDPALLQEVASELAGKPVGIPIIKAGVLFNKNLAGLFRNAHRLLEQDRPGDIAARILLFDALARIIRGYSDPHQTVRALRPAPSAIRLARDFIEAHYPENIPLDTLAGLAGLSPFHFVRVFQKETGLPPHAYLRQVRLRRAKEMLGRGESISSTAQGTGFVDQSHLNRWFKQHWGVTPGQYRNSVQYA
jgi:AraC-like DNA-binding protein